MIRRCIFLHAATLLLAASGALAAETDPVVAVVNGSKVYFSDVAEAQQRLPDQYKQLPMEMVYATLLEQVIRGRLMTAEGLKLNLQNDAEVKKRVASFEALAIQQVYVQRYVDGQITEPALHKRYEETVAALPPQDEVRARHILVKTEVEAKKLIADLKKGADFAELARQFSTDGAAANGGELGYFRQDEMVEEFAVAAFAMRVGQISESPLETQFGFHVIKVEDRRPAAPPTYDEVKDGIRQELVNRVLTAHVAALSSGAAIQRFNADGTPMAPPAVPAPRN